LGKTKKNIDNIVRVVGEEERRIMQLKKSIAFAELMFIQ